MGNEQKDRFGDKLRDLEQAREDKFFADRDRELLAKLKQKKESPAPSTEAEDPKGTDGSDPDSSKA